MSKRIEPSPDISYIIGVNYGDGSIYKYENSFGVRLTTIDKEFLEEWGRCGYSVIGKKGKISIGEKKTHYKKQYYSCIYSKKLYLFLTKSLEEHKSFIEKHPEEFIRGFFDSEGCVRKGTHKGLRISANNTNEEVMEYILKLFEKIGINAKKYNYNYIGRKQKLKNNRYITTRKTIIEIQINKNRDVRIFNHTIGFTINRKKRKIEKYLKKFEKKCVLCDYSFIAKTQYQKYCNICKSIIDKGLYPNHRLKLKKLKKRFINKEKIKPIKTSNNQYKLISRITLDLDDPALLEYSLDVIKQFGFTKDIVIRTSSSGYGKHVIGWTEEGGYPLYQLLFIRRLAKEDETRISLDSWGSGQRMINVLFTGKKRKKLKKGELVFDKQDMQLETQGYEENVKVSFGET